MSTTNLKVNCPHCKKQVRWHDSEQYRPFCSERCQQIDLGSWANEEYSIPVTTNEQWSESDSHPPLANDTENGNDPTLQ